ncbi:MAG: hypothetical protein RSA51_01170 [Niameybacter sp.]
MSYTNRYNNNRNQDLGYCDCNCDCDRPKPQPKQVQCCCGTTGIYEALIALQKSISQISIPGFGVNVHIIMGTGQEYNVLFATGIPNPPQVKCGVLTAGNLTLSLCDISKINIQTSTLNNLEFKKILNYHLLDVTTTTCQADFDEHADGSIACTRGIQSAINKGQTINEISYNGSQEHLGTLTGIGDIHTTQVISDAVLTTTTNKFVTGTTLLSTPQQVVTNVATSNVSVITGVSTKPITVVQGVTPSTTTVSGPLSVTPTTVVSTLVTAPATLVTSVTSTTGTVVTSVTAATATGITSVTPTTGEIVRGVVSTTGTVVTNVASATATAVSSYPAPSTVNGVISGLTNVSIVTPTTATIPVLTTAGTGVLQVVVPPNTFGNANQVILNVTVGGATISLATPVAVKVLPNAATLLSGGTTPVLANNVFTGLGTPITITAVTSVTPSTGVGIATVGAATTTGVLAVTSTTGTVVNSVTPATTTGITGVTSTAIGTHVVASSSTASINNIAAPTTVSVVNGITQTTASATTLAGVTPETISTFVSTATATVVGTAGLNNTTATAVTGATLSTTSARVVQNIGTKTIDVVSPVAEVLTGTITSAGNGILVVNDVSGDVNIYSECEIVACNA